MAVFFVSLCPLLSSVSEIKNFASKENGQGIHFAVPRGCLR